MNLDKLVALILLMMLIVSLYLFSIDFGPKISFGQEDKSNEDYEPVDAGEPREELSPSLNREDLNIPESKISAIKARLTGSEWSLVDSGQRRDEIKLMFRKDFGRTEVTLSQEYSVKRLEMELRDTESGRITYSRFDAIESAKNSLKEEDWVVKEVEEEEGEFEILLERENATARVEIGGSKGEVVSKLITFKQ